MSKKVGALVNSMTLDQQKFLKGAVGAEAAIQSIADDVSAAADVRAAKRGRPSGAKNHEVEVTDGDLTRCRCGSTERGPYFNRRELNICGVHHETKKPYTGIVIRRTICRGCGQARDDRHFVNRPGKK